ncbi:serine hydrolase [Janthinobacterium sp. FW305-128]|uniref:serine hydrolase n=1 Tax=Janthinobacterium sp. FW305-128 TaxID=2775055 RepID=UPI001E44047E|nr:serine hydrolase [Janthinobacterium sp. FW305-128]MCC7680682.1 serine hydrolase [Janthinobacterium sp. FW305-128]
MPPRLRTLLLPLLSLSGGAALAAPTLDAAMRERAETLVRDGKHASLVIAVIDGKDSAVYGFGRVRPGDQGVPDADTVYEIGSVTKTMTGLLLADAVVAGKAQLEQPVAELLPAYAIPALAGQKITVGQLATHFSGLPRLPANLVPADMANPYAGYGEAQLRTFLAGHALARAPGAAYEYSNLAYGLLGTALATQANMSYEELLQARIFRPLGMASSSAVTTPALRAHLAPGHLADGKPAANWDFQAIAGAGAVRSSARDMIAYMQSYMRAASPAQQLAVQPRRVLAGEGDGDGVKKIGLAWMLDQVKGQPFAWHNGQTGGYASFAGYTLDGKRGVVVLSSTARDVDALGVGVLVPGSLPPPNAPAPKEIAIAPSELAQYAGQYALAPTFVLSVRQGPDGLLVGATGQPEAPVYASAKDTFFYKVVEAQLVFQRDAQGAITGVVLHQNGQAMPGKRKP